MERLFGRKQDIRSSSYFPRKPRTSHSTVFASTQADSAKSCDLSREMVRYERGAGRGGCCPRYLDEHETGFQAIETARLQFAATCQARQILSLCAPVLEANPTRKTPGRPRGAPGAPQGRSPQPERCIVKRENHAQRKANRGIDS